MEAMHDNSDDDLAIALEDLCREWQEMAAERDLDWALDEIVVLREFDALEDDALTEECSLLASRPDYQTYLRSRTWRVRADRAKRWGYCVRCGATHARLDAHHTTYEHLGDERPGELVALCRRCHASVHGVKVDP